MVGSWTSTPSLSIHPPDAPQPCGPAWGGACGWYACILGLATPALILTSLAAMIIIHPRAVNYRMTCRRSTGFMRLFRSWLQSTGARRGRARMGCKWLEQEWEHVGCCSSHQAASVWRHPTPLHEREGQLWICPLRSLLIGWRSTVYRLNGSQFSGLINAERGLARRLAENVLHARP